MRLKLIACEIFYRELCAAVARSVNQVDIEFLPKGLHDIGQAGMSARLGEVLAAIKPKFRLTNPGPRRMSRPLLPNVY